MSQTFPNHTETASNNAPGTIDTTIARYSVHDDWDTRIQELLEYRMRFGTFTISTKDASHLQKWVTHLRQHDEQLSPAQVKQLMNIGFFGKQAGTWELNFAKLCAYKERFGDCMVPVRWKEDRKLGKWVSRHRDSYYEAHLTKERIARLDAVGFAWKIAGKRQSHTEQPGKTLPETKPREHGEPPSRSKSARSFVSAKKKQKTSHVVDTNQMAGGETQPMVNKPHAGDRQEVVVGEEEKWNEQFVKLVKFQCRNGHMSIPREEDPVLWEWVQSHRVLWNQGCLKGVRRKQLQKIGFEISDNNNKSLPDTNVDSQVKLLSCTRPPTDNQGSKGHANTGILLAQKSNETQSIRNHLSALHVSVGLGLDGSQECSQWPSVLRSPSTSSSPTKNPTVTTTNAEVEIGPDDDASHRSIEIVYPGTSVATTTGTASLASDPCAAAKALVDLSNAAADALIKIRKGVLLTRESPSGQFGMNSSEQVESSLLRGPIPPASTMLTTMLKTKDLVGNLPDCKVQEGSVFLRRQAEQVTPSRKNGLTSEDFLVLSMMTDKSKATFGDSRPHDGSEESRPVSQDSSSVSYQAGASGVLPTVSRSPSHETQRQEAILVASALKEGRTPMRIPHTNDNDKESRKRKKRSRAGEEEHSFAVACRTLVQGQGIVGSCRR